jgi:diguanylate cyclase (GGDEF)-like protein
MPRFDVRFGITSRLAIAFVAVAILAVAANFIAEYGTSIVRTTEIRIVTPAADARPATRSPARPAQPPAPAPAVAAHAKALSVAVERYTRTVRARVNDDGPESVLPAYQATETLAEREAAFLQAATQAGAKAELRDLQSALQKLRRQATGVVRSADEERRLRKAYAASYESLDARSNRALDGAWKVFGRVVARQSVVEMSRAIDDMRPHVNALVLPDAAGGDSILALAAGEAALAELLEGSAGSLTRSQGADWVSAMRADLAALAASRQALGKLEARAVDGLTALEQANKRVGELVRGIQASAARVAVTVRKSVEPSRGPPTRWGVRRVRSTTETVVGAGRDNQQVLIAWLSAATLLLLLGISVGTVLSIVRPVRSLTSATERLARGERNVFVPRGGIKELDVLAASFNAMAERLADAQDLAHQYHGQLEARVEERTRQLQHLAEHDPLTQLPNRRQLFAKLNSLLQQAAMEKFMVGIYFIDLDNFKNINDSMGHVFGDRVLQTIAKRLEHVCRPFGFAARLGGDEFTVVYARATHVDDIVAAGQSLVEAFMAPLKIDGRELTVSVSVGSSVYPEHATDADALLRAADAALFRAKALGRSQMSVFSADLLHAAASKFTTEQGLRRAIEHGEFELLFQPEVSAATGEADIVEALLRWRLPNGQVVIPDDFLSIAEESGLITQISEWVVRSAVETAAQWHHGGWPGARVAINVSARQLVDGSLADKLQDLTRKHRLPASCIELELTENVLQTGPGTVAALLQLRAAGFGVALDDFGTGYSSLVSLEQLPLTRVKLDRALIASIDTSTRSLAIARAIIGLCEGLNLQITAEGVERSEQLLPLLNHRGMHVQGYLLAQPLPASELLQARARLPARWAGITAERTRRKPLLTSVG